MDRNARMFALVAAVFLAMTGTRAAEKKINVAVINLKNATGVQTGEAEIITDRLRAELFNTGVVNVMEREQMQDILKEQGFQASGACTDEACLVEMGQLLGVQKLITGSIGKLGSMFMLNLREIDVQTARISKAVSKDISGDIEKVVYVLRDIARELAGPAVEPAPRQAPPKEPEVKKVEPPPEEPAKAQEKIEEAKPQEPPQAPKDDAADKNIERKKNRSGIRLALSLYPGKFVETIQFSGYDYGNNKTIDTSITVNYNKGGWNTVSYHPVINPQLLFMIRIGQHVSLNVGMSYSKTGVDLLYDSAYIYSSTYSDYYDYTYIITKRVNEFDFALEPTFVRRWHPLKLNAGLLVGIGFASYIQKFEEKWDYYVTSDVSDDSTAREMGVGFSMGGRVGPEILAGPHVGFSGDIFFKYAKQLIIMETDSLDDGFGSYADRIRHIAMPVFGFGFGVNFYF